MVQVDGDTSTNDTIIALSSGLSGSNRISSLHSSEGNQLQMWLMRVIVVIYGRDPNWGRIACAAGYPILVYMSKVDGRFNFSPISVNFLTEVAKVIFALVMLLIHARNQKIGEKPLLSVSSFVQAARNNVLLEIYYKNSTGGSELSTN
ncbi:hypothetical protein Lser_V15G03331 [Lactuca serriola]